MHFQVQVMVPGFNGDFKAEMQVGDLERFEKDLREMEQKIGIVREAVLSSVEPGIFISLKSNKFGQVTGEYQFESERYEGDPTCLSGVFEFDQTYLKPLAKLVAEDINKIKL